MAAFGPSQIKLLEKLCTAAAVSGDEGEVRSLVLEAIKPHCSDVRVDALGNVLGVRKGSALEVHQGRTRRRLRVMISAHMDEVGFMLVAEDGDGLYRFEPVGGIDLRQLVGKAVLVGSKRTPGVIGARPIHLTTAEERKRTITLETLRIDLGPGGKADLGDRAVFATRFLYNKPSIMARALDDRLGVALLIELVKEAPETIDLLAAFTVQEEVGLRGARVAAHALDPDLAVVVDSTPANDLPDWEGKENEAYNTRLGGGPAIYIADGATISDPRLVRHFAAAAEAEGIPYQFRQPGGGGTDAGAIHKARAGIPSVSISVPHRYGHTPVLLARFEDWKNTHALLLAGLRRLTPGILTGERK